MRWAMGVVVVLLVSVAALTTYIISGAARGPKVDGRLAFAGLTDRVEVIRDEHGIPYVFAQNTADLIRAQGFVTAQARIFQMESYRKIILGKLAEAIGEKGLPSDREMRLVGLRRNAERHAALLSPSAREFLGWYADGINAYINGHANDLPVELKLAGFRASPWSVEDLVLVLHFVSWTQAVNYKTELVMQQLIDKLGAQRAKELFPINRNPDRQQPLNMIATLSGATWSGAGQDVQLGSVAGDALQAPIALGSNCWAIAPSRSASGAAVVVNDPHLDAHVLPGIWFPIGLFTPQLRAIGVGIPGVPGILIGRNEHVAFGITNSYGDSQDLFIEQIARDRPDHYVEGDTERPFETTVEVIRVKDDKAPGGMREEKLTVRRTVRGPIISDKPLGAQSGRLLSLRMASAELTDRELGIDRLLVARSAEDVDQAVQKLGLMYLNFVFADKAGVIGHRASGRVPIRRSKQGLYPKPVTREDDWQGFIPPDRMPGQVSPARGWLASANNDNRPDGYEYDYSSYFAPYRYERIAQVLQGSPTMTLADHLKLLGDIQNIQALRLLPSILAALKTEPEQADLVAILAAWDGHDGASLAAPLIYHRLYEQIAYETFVDKLGEELTRAYLKQWYVWQERFDQLARTPDSPWFDDTRTPARETLPDLIRRAAHTVRAELTARYGSDPKTWRWGAEHRIRFVSPMRQSGFGRDWLGRAATPMDGSGETVMRGRTSFMGGFDVEFFDSLRLVADLADDQKIEAVLPGGVVERQFHPNQKDQLDTWFDRGLLPWWFDRQAIEAHAQHRQVLVPLGQ